MDTEVIEKLLQIKKKSKASKADKNSFQNEWLYYVSEHGFNDKAEAFLYDGFSFPGTFITYLSKTNDKQETANQLLSGKYFYKNNSITFKVMLHLLALLIEKLPDEKTLMMMVVRRLPELSNSRAVHRSQGQAQHGGAYRIPPRYRKDHSGHGRQEGQGGSPKGACHGWRRRVHVGNAQYVSERGSA